VIDVDVMPEHQPCPECRAGKCRNCDGLTWDFRIDDYTACPCYSAGHS